MTNLGKYNEGQLVYERVAFPTDTETVQAALKKIGIDGIRYEEIFIADYDGGIPQLYEYLINDIDYKVYRQDHGSTRAGTSPPAGTSRGDIPLRSITTGSRTFPTNTGYSPCLKCPSGSKWLPIRKWRNRLTRPPSAPHPRRAGRSGSPLDTVSRGGR